MNNPIMPPQKSPPTHWVQTEREAHEAWSILISKSPTAARIMHLFVARVGEHNAVVVSQPTLAKLLGCHVNTVANAIRLLTTDRWIEVRRVGGSGTTNAYVLNDRVAWVGSRDGIRYSLFSASVVISDEEQPDRAELGQQKPLRHLPRIGEMQLPVGDGLPPPSQPFLSGLEPDLPACNIDKFDAD
ncbi:helix-turn-helix domain-containing protein [Bacillus anthracis]|uniref:helix-turn-helix domain-containing protein n=1 Tax=Bacillus anthracis TaxID=1392 RepID=UPI0039A589EB